MKKVNNRLNYIILILMFSNFSFSQNRKINNLNLRANFQKGFLLPEYSFFSYLTNDNIKAFEFNVYKELPGNKLWQRLYKYPSLGFSFFFTSLGNDDVYGKAFSINPSIKFNLLSKQKFRIQYSFGTGLTYVTKRFDFNNNYQNIAVASHLNIWLNTELTAMYSFNSGLSIFAGTAFNHLSNANLSEPNIGLNTWTFLMGTDVKIGDNSEKNTDAIPVAENSNEYAFVIAGANKHTRRFAEQTYFAASISFEFNRNFGHKFRLGTGTDIFYDSSIPDEMARANISDIKNFYKFKTGLHISEELIFGKISAIIQEGLYIILTDKLNNNKIYNRGTLRYKINDKFFVDLTMKSNVFILDVMEFGFGYYWK